MTEIDVRGLSCPEPVLMTMDAMEDYKGEDIVVIGDEAHTKKNMAVMLEQYGKSYKIEDTGKEFKIRFKA